MVNIFRSLLVLYIALATCWGSQPEDFALIQHSIIEMYTIRIQNQAAGKIEATTDNINWLYLGDVIKPVQCLNNKGFTASKWGKCGTVVGSAVNAIHIKTAHNNLKDAGVIFSLLPSEQLAKSPEEYKSYLNPEASLYTNIRAGTSLFGGEWSVVVGNLIFLEKNNKLSPLPYGYTPTLNDTIIIKVYRPDPYPKEIVFENRFGGAITITYPRHSAKLIGQVLKPVYGVGRFIGTKYCDVGRVRANHNGVIDISTSPLNQIGGFQIIPAQHSESPEMADSKVKTQWMIIGPSNAAAPGNEGLSPFFSDYLMPRYDETSFSSDNWIEKTAQQTLVQVKYKGQKRWASMPIYSLNPDQPIPEKYNTALENIEKIRILFPIFKNNEVRLPLVETKPLFEELEESNRP